MSTATVSRVLDSRFHRPMDLEPTHDYTSAFALTKIRCPTLVKVETSTIKNAKCDII